MKDFKTRWEITQNWQLIHIILGLVGAFFSAFLIARAIYVPAFKTSIPVATILLSIPIAFLIIWITLWLFKKLYKRWDVTYRWELVAIFLAFAVTGSTAGRISNPLMDLIGLGKDVTSGWVYWPVRILLIFPIYQVLLVIFGWIFGQYSFFKAFATKMVSRMGLGFLFSKDF